MKHTLSSIDKPFSLKNYCEDLKGDAEPCKVSSTKNTSKSFNKKLDDEMYSEFNKKDWLQYWIKKAEEHGVRYFVGNYLKEYAILSSLMKNFEVSQIKTMIDFLWDSDQDIQKKSTMGIWMLSKGWLNTVLQSSIEWSNGQYKNGTELKAEKVKQVKEKTKRNREWVSDEPKEDKPKKKKSKIYI